jgi:hypothetical protein
MNGLMHSAEILGSALLSLCAIPYMIEVLRNGFRGSMVFFLMWLVGELCLLAVMAVEGRIPLLVNYGVNTICLLVVAWKIVFPGKVRKQ